MKSAQKGRGGVEETPILNHCADLYEMTYGSPSPALTSYGFCVTADAVCSEH